MSRQIIIHIGYFKTGTTWFQKEFFPKVDNAVFANKANASLDDNLILTRPYDFSPLKVSNYIDNLFLNEDSSKLILSRERLSGHPFTGGYDAQIIADRLKATYPNAKIVIFIREQLDAIVSTYKEYIKRGGVAPFKAWITTQGRTIPSFELDYFNYYKQIDYYMNLFDKTNVLVCTYEDFKTNPSNFIETFCTDLGLEYHYDQSNFNTKVNRGFSTFSLKLIRWSNKFSNSKNLNPYNSLKIPFLRFVIEKICLLLDSLFYKRLNTSFFNSELLAETENIYREGNTNLCQLLNLDLQNKGYLCSRNNKTR